VKWRTDKPGCADRSNTILQRIVIVRYAILLPCLGLYLGLSYTSAFITNFVVGQLWCVPENAAAVSQAVCLSALSTPLGLVLAAPTPTYCLLFALSCTRAAPL
jgi:hypothetical protein